MKRYFCLLFALVVLLSACAGTGEETASVQEETAETALTVLSAERGDMFTDRDLEVGYDEATCIPITLNGDSIQCDSGAVTISGSTATITRDGTYLLSGSLNDGMILVDGDGIKVQLVLDNVSIHSETSAAIYVRDADKVFITTAADSQNQLSNGGSYESIDENKIDAVIFSKDDLTLNGLGTLTIQAAAGHGVVSKDDLVIASGTYQITAEKKGLSGQDSVRIADGSITITSGTDGIQAENEEDAEAGFLYIAGGSFALTTEGDGISASGTLQIEDGSFQILAGGGSANGAAQTDAFAQGNWGRWDGMAMNEPATDESATADPEMTDPGMNEPEMTEPPTSETEAAGTETEITSTKGIKATGALLISGGDFSIDSADDGIHSNSSLTVSGGSYKIATGDDGFHADGALSISAGTILISESYEGIEGLTIDISGGEIQLQASDDGLNAAGGTDSSGFWGGRMDTFAADADAAILISGGKLVIDAEGDGIDSNGSLTITGGEIYVDGPTNGGNGPVDYGTSAEISGGILLAVGSSQMVENFQSSSTQGIATLTTDTQQAGSAVTLTDSAGQQLLSWTSAKTFDCVIVSCPELAVGETYTLTAGSYEETFTLDSLVYGAASGLGMGGMNDQGGQFGGGGRQDGGDFTMPDGTAPGGTMDDGTMPGGDMRDGTKGAMDGEMGELQPPDGTDGTRPTT